MQAMQRGKSTRKVQKRDGGAVGMTAEDEDDGLLPTVEVKLTYEETSAGDDWEARVWLTEID